MPPNPLCVGCEDSLQLLEPCPDALTAVIATIATKIRLGKGAAVDYNQRNLPGTPVALHCNKCIISEIEGFRKGR
jgi:hypothetical protein